MRITNKIMQDNSLSNINNNKVLMDKLQTQMSSGKKINRPSDDPVIAIRSLRLRSTLSEVTQYRDKNVEDAKSWLKVTEDSINTVTEVLTDMQEQCNKGANEELTTQNREAILESLKALRDEIYASGDADYAGRGVFTGYRTGTKLRFQTDEKKTYQITEKLEKAALDDITYIKMDNGSNSIGEINSGNYNTADYAIKETAVSQETVHRLRLSYGDLDAGMTPVISYYNDTTGVPKNIPVTTISKYGGDNGEDPYQYAQTQAGEHAVFIPETGELILNDAAYQALSSVRDYSATDSVNEGEILVSYQKTDWKKGDLQPEHYFECVEDPAGKAIVHNKDQDADAQVISYDVGFNQEIRVNTMASECYTHGIGRDVDDLISVIEQVGDVEAAVAALDSVVKNPDTSKDDREKAEESLRAANKALTYLKEKMQTSFESGITKMQNHLNTTTLALTAVGTRSSKLTLVETRLTSQKTNFKDLVSDNEQADTAEVATDLASAKLAYDAALMATGKVTDSTLMNFI